MEAGKNAVCLMIGNNKGGVGKSTIAATLAVGLVRRGFKVLVLDADSQQSLGKWRMAAMDSETGADKKADALPWVERADSLLIGEKIKMERPNYDYLIVDTASNIGFAGDMAQKVLLTALKQADHVFIPIGPSILDVDGSDDFVSLLRDIWERRDTKTPHAAVIINAIKKNTTLGREVGDYVKQEFDLDVLTHSLGHREAYKRAFFGGGTVYAENDQRIIAEADALVDEILEQTRKAAH